MTVVTPSTPDATAARPLKPDGLAGPRNGSGGSLVRNTAASYFATAAGTLTGFVVTPLILARLGADSFGAWVLIGTVVGYLGLLDTGLYATISTRVAECLAVGDFIRLEGVLGTAALIYLLLAVATIVLSGGLSMAVSAVFHLPPQTTAAARGCVLLLAANRGVLFLFAAQNAALFGAGRLDLLMTTTAWTNTLTGIVTGALAVWGLGIRGLAAGTLAVGVLGMLTVRRLVARHVPEARFRLRAANATTARELWTFGSRNAVISLAGTISYGCDTVVVGLLLPVANAAYYAVAAKLVNLVNELSTRPVTTLLPAYSHAQAVRQDQRQFRLFTESVTFSLAICLPFVIALCAFGNRIVEAWVGPGHAAASPIAAVLGIALLLILPGYACFTILTGNDRTAFLAKLYIVAAGANLGLSILLTSRLGAIGVALGSMITAAVVDFGVLPVLVCYEFGFRYRSYLALALRPLLAPLVIATTVAVGLRWAQPEPRRIPTLFMLAAVVGPAWVAWLAVGLDRSRREVYFRSLRSLIAKR